jgi:hypothetical protein
VGRLVLALVALALALVALALVVPALVVPALVVPAPVVPAPVVPAPVAPAVLVAPVDPVDTGHRGLRRLLQRHQGWGHRHLREYRVVNGIYRNHTRAISIGGLWVPALPALSTAEIRTTMKRPGALFIQVTPVGSSGIAEGRSSRSWQPPKRVHGSGQDADLSRWRLTSTSRTAPRSRLDL